MEYPFAADLARSFDQRSPLGPTSGKKSVWDRNLSLFSVWDRSGLDGMDSVEAARQGRKQKSTKAHEVREVGREFFAPQR